MNKKKYISKYIKNFCKVVMQGEAQIDELIDTVNSLKKSKSNNSIHIFGNGGSASIASHFSMDLTYNSNIKCLSYNDPAIITCFANDFKYENWISRVINKYGKK